MFRQVMVMIILVAFMGTSIPMPTYAQGIASPMPWMPKPGAMVGLSPSFTPSHLTGMVIHPDNGLEFDFLIRRGDESLSEEQKQDEYKKLIKYFLASLAVPDENQWVNLSPYEKNRIIKDDFGLTEMGRDLLAQDYILKQITASLIYPEKGLGKEFWNKIYAQAQEQYGTSSIPVNTFNKVWILPDEASVYETGNTVYVVKNHLKVMLEEDYLSLQKHTAIENTSSKVDVQEVNKIGSKIVREIVLPALEKEVNEGKNFANLRQIYSGMILAAWYKKALKESLLGKIYTNKAAIKGIDQNPQSNQEIYQQYLQAYKKGVFNFIKEDIDKYSNQTIPRKYFSGGAVNDYAMILKISKNSKDGGKAMLLGMPLDVSVRVMFDELGKSLRDGLKQIKDALRPLPFPVEDFRAGSYKGTLFSGLSREQLGEFSKRASKDRRVWNLFSRLRASLKGLDISARAMETLEWRLLQKRSTQDIIVTVMLTYEVTNILRYLKTANEKTVYSSDYSGVSQAVSRLASAIRSNPIADLPYLSNVLMTAFSLARKNSRGDVLVDVLHKLSFVVQEGMVDSHSFAVRDQEIQSLLGINSVFMNASSFSGALASVGKSLSDFDSAMLFDSVKDKGWAKSSSDPWWLKSRILAIVGLVTAVLLPLTQQVDSPKSRRVASASSLASDSGDRYLFQGFAAKEIPLTVEDMSEPGVRNVDDYLLVLNDADTIRRNLITKEEIDLLLSAMGKNRTLETPIGKIAVDGDSNPRKTVAMILVQKLSFNDLMRVKADNKHPLNGLARYAIELLGGSANMERIEQAIKSITQMTNQLMDIKEFNQWLNTGDMPLIFTSPAAQEKLMPVLARYYFHISLKALGVEYENREVIIGDLLKLLTADENLADLLAGRIYVDPKMSVEEVETFYLRSLFNLLENHPNLIKLWGINENVDVDAVRKSFLPSSGKSIQDIIETENTPIVQTNPNGATEIAQADVKPGGIDLNSANLNLQIKRDGRGVPLPISQQNWEKIKIDGLIPVIMEIKPAVALPVFSSLQNPQQSA